MNRLDKKEVIRVEVCGHLTHAQGQRGAQRGHMKGEYPGGGLRGDFHPAR